MKLISESEHIRNLLTSISELSDEPNNNVNPTFVGSISISLSASSSNSNSGPTINQDQVNNLMKQYNKSSIDPITSVNEFMRLMNVSGKELLHDINEYINELSNNIGFHATDSGAGFDRIDIIYESQPMNNIHHIVRLVIRMDMQIKSYMDMYNKIQKTIHSSSEDIIKLDISGELLMKSDDDMWDVIGDIEDCRQLAYRTITLDDLLKR